MKKIFITAIVLSRRGLLFISIAISIALLAAYGLSMSTPSSAEDKDQCVSCHTDAGKLKKLITKFPEHPAEEGEG